MKRIRNRKSRRAVSLIELLLIMSAATVLLTLTGALIHRVLHSQSKARAFDDAQRTAFRLSEHFRRDALDAITVDLPADKAGHDLLCQMHLSGQTVEYRRDKDRLQRIVHPRGDSVKVRSREDFIFPTRPAFAIRSEHAGKLLVLAGNAESGSALDANGNAQQAVYAMPLALEIVAARGAGSSPSPHESPSDAPTQESRQ